MLLSFVYLYKFIMFYFLVFFQKAENNRLKKASLQKFCKTIFLVFAQNSVGRTRRPAN